MNRASLCLSSRSWSLFTDSEGMEGWVGLSTTTVSKESARTATWRMSQLLAGQTVTLHWVSGCMQQAHRCYPKVRWSGIEPRLSARVSVAWVSARTVCHSGNQLYRSSLHVSAAQQSARPVAALSAGCSDGRTQCDANWRLGQCRHLDFSPSVDYPLLVLPNKYTAVSVDVVSS